MLSMLALALVAMCTFAGAAFAEEGNNGGGEPGGGNHQPITLCHHTGSASNPYVVISPDDDAVFKQGHDGHDDIIPAFTWVDDNGVTQNYGGKNLGTLAQWPWTTGAAVLANGCNVPPEPPDLCPNLEGWQQSIPEGLVLVNGQCVTPPPDVCPNIEGAQSAPPTGTIIDAAGNCVAPPPPPPPADVCPNIEGAQSAVPTGLVKDAAGNCVPTVVAGVVTPPTETAGSSGTPEGTTPGTETAGAGGTPTETAGETATPTTTAATTAGTGELPFTGADERLPGMLGALLLLAGLAMHAWAVRRERVSTALAGTSETCEGAADDMH